MGYGDYVIGDSVISRVYYVEGLGHNLFSVGQFCDSDLEVAFRKHSCYVRDTEGVELKFEKDHLCAACQLGKSKKLTHKPNAENTNLEVLHTLHMDLCKPMRVQTINGKRYILVIVDDFSRFTWVKFLRSKDETPEVIIKFRTQIQRGLNKTVRYIRTDNGTDFVNKTLNDYNELAGFFTRQLFPRLPHKNGVVEDGNRTLVEAARTMIIYSKAPMFLWAEVVATACYTQNRSLIHTRHNKTPYELNGVVERRNRTLVEAARTMIIYSKAPMFLWAEAVATASVQSSGSGITFLLAVIFFFRQWEVPSGSGNFLTSKDAINHLAVLESLQSSKSSKQDHLPSVKNSPLEACSRSLQRLDPSSEDSPSLLA
nr:putative ribonuclease H-like domain-containing protein [Tanacetum cinerariifolium]